MFNLGFSELIILALIALIFLDPKQLPGIARTVGKFISDLKRSTNSLTTDFKDLTVNEVTKNIKRPDTPPVAEETKNKDEGKPEHEGETKA